MQVNGLTRRGMLTMAGAGTVAAATGWSVSSAAAETTSDAQNAASDDPRDYAGRIDVHHHAVPDAMRRWAIEQGLIPDEGELPDWAKWTLPSTLETMRANGIAAGIASAPAPADVMRDRAVAEEGIRIMNGSLAELVADHPSRFGFFANVATHHPRLAARQAAHALDELDADGVLLMTTAGERYLGDPHFDPLFAELNERRAVVLIHPGMLPAASVELPGVNPSIADFLLDTTRTALNLAASGTLDRFPDVSIILSHAGGFLPWAAERALSTGRQGDGPDPAALRRALGRFYYDTALPMSPYATPSLLAAAEPSRILFGTDWPARPADEVGRLTDAFDADRALSGRLRRDIGRDNALRLFPRLAARLGAGVP